MKTFWSGLSKVLASLAVWAAAHPDDINAIMQIAYQANQANAAKK